jgi:hypothetical protein
MKLGLALMPVIMAFPPGLSQSSKSVCKQVCPAVGQRKHAVELSVLVICCVHFWVVTLGCPCSHVNRVKVKTFPRHSWRMQSIPAFSPVGIPPLEATLVFKQMAIRASSPFSVFLG